MDSATEVIAYDGLGRITRKTVKHGSTAVMYDSYTYKTGTADASGQVATVEQNGVTYTYTYDDNGNILSISDGTNTTSYVYDSANQLIRENNQAGGYSYTWTYDNGGNIRTRKEFAYGDGVLGSSIRTVNYAYGDSNWGDKLTSYDGKAITYDQIGNPLSYDGWTYTWRHGRQLATAAGPTLTWNYTYNDAGLRTKKVGGYVTVTYAYNGDQLSEMLFGNKLMKFTYDASGTPLTINFDGTTYYYVTNLQGDVVKIIDTNRNVVVTYSYDAWGKLLSTTGSMASTLGSFNPLRYRGYVYDVETGLYYLQSRYYDPEWGRFINGDAYASTGQGFTGNNMFAYCNNNPVMLSDTTGTLPAYCVLMTDTGGKYPRPYGAATPYRPTTSIEYNCCAYALDETKWRDVGEPGLQTKGMSLDAVTKLIIEDVTNLGRSIRIIESHDAPIEPSEYRIAFRMSEEDYHFMKQHNDGSWSRKPGVCASRLLEAKNPDIIPWDCPIIDTLIGDFVCEIGIQRDYYDSRIVYFAITR